MPRAPRPRKQPRVMGALSERVPEAVVVKRRQQRSSERVYSTRLRDGQSRGATGRGAGRAWCGQHKYGEERTGLHQQHKAPPDLLTGQSTLTCLHEAHYQDKARRRGDSCGSGRAQTYSQIRRDRDLFRTKQNAKLDRIPFRPSATADRSRMTTWTHRTGATRLWSQRPPRAVCGGRGEWCWSDQQTSRST